MSIDHNTATNLYTDFEKFQKNLVWVTLLAIHVYTGAMKASDKVYESLRADIVEWRLAPVPSLPKWNSPNALEFPAHRCVKLRQIIADGLAVQQRGRGAIVSEVSEDHVEDLFVLLPCLECAQCAKRQVRTAIGVQPASRPI
ncbi:hypothetical protein [Glutamicibacter protophormiae]|uniref:hypothetical protein n=1 Tax=Glutamicibacter protophormiae TaxID=37930 RepID=UPI003A937436